MRKQLLAVGVTFRPHGVKGEISITPFADPKSLFKDTVFLQYRDTQPKEMKVLSFRAHHGRPLLCFKGYPDRTTVEQLCGQTVLIPRADCSTPRDEGAYYLSELLGCSVFLESTGEAIGVLERVAFPGGQELWSIVTPDRKEIFLPGVPEFVGRIDLENNKVYIRPPSGLLELYR